jgi:DNA repair exonuclease SbcCD ATPase subunit
VTVTANEPDADAAAELRAADERVDRLRSRLSESELDRNDLDTVADAYRSVEAVLDRWEERATDWDDFEGYVEFRDALAETLESIPDDVPERDAFLEADERVKTESVSKSLDSSDFDAAREALTPVREYAELRSELEDALDDRKKVRTRAQKRRKELEERIDDLERLLDLGEADLDAPIDRLREPIEAYNEDVTAAFRTFRREEPAETVLSFVADAARTPFVGYEPPPSELLEYVRTAEAGERSVDELLEYADYSASKLSHYVDDADRLKRRVATNRTYLERLSADPLRIEWPPAPAETLRFRIEELVPLVGRFADESTVATLRELRELTRGEDYGRIRQAATADAELTAEQRRRIERGEVEAELEAAREALERIEAALSECGG